jgi:DNA-binding response OmpR family regulator/REP element-mobilizing transposase RayT
MVPILVATPHAAFGELLRISLEESGHYQVRLVSTAKEARASVGRADYQLAILDSELADEPFVPLCLDFISKPIKVMIVPPDNNPNHASLGGLMPDGYLYRPFYLPDLLDTVQNLIQPATEQASPTQEHLAAPGWASDPLALQLLLEQELSDNDAIAILVGMQGNLLGSAGLLNTASINEMANIVRRYWDSHEKTDLMRYVRLSITKSDYLVYATPLDSDLVLMMVFHPGAQLSQVRPQTKQVANRLNLHAAGYQPPIAPHKAEPANSETAMPLNGANNGRADPNLIQEADPVSHHTSAIIEPQTEPEDESGLFSNDGESFIFTGPGSRLTVGQKPQPDEQDFFDEDLAARKIDLDQLLGTIPSPDPSPGTEPPQVGTTGLFGDWFPGPDEWQAAGARIEPGQAEASPAASSSELAGEQTLSQAVPVETAPAEEKEAAALQDDLPAAEQEPAVKDNRPGGLSGSLEEAEVSTRPVASNAAEAGKANTVPAPFFLEPEPEIDPLGDTRPRSTVVPTIASISQLEPVSPALSLLNYTCVLLPRLPQHYLAGELADRLAQWVQHLCLAFGWRLEGISLRPEYLQWTVQVAPSVSPGNLVRIIRQRTSLHIFNTYDYIKQQNPSGDFWATGYLIVSGPQPPSAQLLREYIAQTRKRQGIPKI